MDQTLPNCYKLFHVPFYQTAVIATQNVFKMLVALRRNALYLHGHSPSAQGHTSDLFKEVNACLVMIWIDMVCFDGYMMMKHDFPGYHTWFAGGKNIKSHFIGYVRYFPFKPPFIDDFHGLSHIFPAINLHYW